MTTKDANGNDSRSAIIAALDTSPSDVQSDLVVAVVNGTERDRWMTALDVEAIRELTHRFRVRPGPAFGAYPHPDRAPTQSDDHRLDPFEPTLA